MKIVEVIKKINTEIKETCTNCNVKLIYRGLVKSKIGEVKERFQCPKCGKKATRKKAINK